jgi:hypothetical protein
MVNKHIILSLIILSFSCNYKNNFPTEINSKENKLIKDSIDILNFKGKKVKIDINGNNYVMIEYSFDLVNLHKESINIGISDNNFLDLFNKYIFLRKKNKKSEWALINESNGNYYFLNPTKLINLKSKNSNSNIKIFTTIDSEDEYWNRIDSFGIGIPYFLKDSTKLIKNIFFHKNIISDVKIDSFPYLLKDLKSKNGRTGLK